MDVKKPKLDWKKQDKEYLYMISPYGGDEILIKFECPKCNNTLEWPTIIPAPYYFADSIADSDRFIYEDVWCEHCDYETAIEVSNGIGGMLIQITDVPIDDIFFTKLNDELKYILSSDDYYKNFKQEIMNLRNILNQFKEGDEYDDSFEEDNIIDAPTELKRAIKNMCYIHLVTTLETYLSDALIINIKNNEKHLKNFVKNYKWEKTSKIELNKIFEVVENIENLVYNEIIGKTLFHKIYMIEKIYESAFNISFTNNKHEIVEIIQLRHDLVHRNGFTKEGEPIIIRNLDLFQDIKKVEDFVDQINNKMNELET